MWDERLPLVKCNFQQIEHVLINIIKNAYQALADNFSDDRLIEIRGEVTDCSLHLTIANNGPNIPPEILKNVLAPFITTKSENEGTGLGQSITEEIMKEHNGKLEICSEPTSLTKVTMILPLSEDT